VPIVAGAGCDPCPVRRIEPGRGSFLGFAVGSPTGTIPYLHTLSFRPWLPRKPAAGTVAGSLRFDLQALGADQRRGRLRTVTGSGGSPAADGHQVRTVTLPGRYGDPRGPAADGARCAASSPAAVVTVTGSGGSPAADGDQVRTVTTSRPPSPEVTTAAGTVAGSLRFDLQALGADQRRGRLRSVPGARCAASSPAAVVTVTGSGGAPAADGDQVRTVTLPGRYGDLPGRRGDDGRGDRRRLVAVRPRSTCRPWVPISAGAGCDPCPVPGAPHRARPPW